MVCSWPYHVVSRCSSCHVCRLNVLAPSDAMQTLESHAISPAVLKIPAQWRAAWQRCTVGRSRANLTHRLCRVELMARIFFFIATLNVLRGSTVISNVTERSKHKESDSEVTGGYASCLVALKVQTRQLKEWNRV